MRAIAVADPCLMGGFDRLMDATLHEELQAVLAYRSCLDQETGVWDSYQMLTLLALSRAKDEAQDATNKLFFSQALESNSPAY